MSETVTRLCQLTNLMINCLLLSWCGYWTSSNYSNIQQQPIPSYRQKSKLLTGVWWPTIVETATNRLYAWHFKYANTTHTVLRMYEQWFNLWLYRWHSLLPVEKKKHHVTHHAKFATIHWNFTGTILYMYYTPIIIRLYTLPIIHNLWYNI